MQKKAQKLNERINIEIMENELEAMDWPLHRLSCELYWWVDFFNLAFFKEQPVPVPALSFEKTTVRTLGHYVIGRNAFGVKENINLNRCHLRRPLWDLLATLLHELCHSWQALYGTPSNSWFHNREFQDKMLSIGIICDSKGCHIGLADPFVYLLGRHGVSFDALPDQASADGMLKIPPKPKPKGESKLKKWTCGCTNIRVAVQDLQAQCLKCGNRFEMAL